MKQSELKIKLKNRRKYPWTEEEALLITTSLQEWMKKKKTNIWYNSFCRSIGIKPFTFYTVKDKFKSVKKIIEECDKEKHKRIKDINRDYKIKKCDKYKLKYAAYMKPKLIRKRQERLQNKFIF